VARKKILIADDNVDNRRILIYRLQKIGRFDIREVTTGEQAVAAFAAERPHLIIMDNKMPIRDGDIVSEGLPGWEAIKRIRQMGGGDAVRILAVSAQSVEVEGPRALAYGADEFLAMPIDPVLLLQKLERLIGILD
jgi:CheY-like chemotaxis protein